MHILKESEEPYIQQCSECGTVLQYSKDDIYMTNKVYYFGYGAFAASFDFIICPSCGAKIPATKEFIDEKNN